ncbi:hypothetical protein ACLIBG_14580 [Virgibacillus sp. W0181]|uniref:hypothetical protein n=1 Tax=Virgibacillus sp. W0181 TaxID=3391581 RepID=UPI003F48E1A2
MLFWTTFLQSLQLPSKRSVFKLNRVGMDIIVIYMFILLFLVSIPSFLEQIANPDGFRTNMNLFFFLIYFFIFYYLPLNVIIFGLLSVIAFVGKKFASLMKRKLHFSILWKMGALSSTVPFLVYTLLALFFPISDRVLWIGLVYILILLIKIILIYPKRKRRRAS